MPKTFSGILGWLVSTIIVVAVGLWIINRVGPLANFVASPTKNQGAGR